MLHSWIERVTSVRIMFVTGEWATAKVLGRTLVLPWLGAYERV